MSTGHIGHASIEGTLAEPVLQFDLAAEAAQLRQEESWLHGAGRSSRTLAKYDDLRIVLVAMKAKARLREHAAAGRISICALQGHILLHLPQQTVDLPAGSLMTLDQCVPHEVEAVEDSSFLLTMSWPEGARSGRKTGRDRTARNTD